MHAGDAYWRLYGLIAVLEQLFPTDPKVTFLAESMKTCVNTIGAHIAVPEPSLEDLGKILEVIRVDLPEGVAPAAVAAVAGGKTTANREAFGSESIIDGARAFVNSMVESQLFGWADMVADINDRLGQESPFFTYKQARALLNIAARGEFEDGPDFMTQMADDHPEATRVMQDWAAQA